MIEMVTTNAKNGYNHTTTDELAVYKWLAETMVYKHRGSKDITRIKYHEQYDGHIHATFYVSNGTKVEITIPRS